MLLEEHELHLVVLELVVAARTVGARESTVGGVVYWEPSRARERKMGRSIPHGRRRTMIKTWWTSKTNNVVRFAAHIQPVRRNLDIERPSAV